MYAIRSYYAYPQDSGCTPCSGREAYARYSAQAFQKVQEVGGTLVYQAEAIGRFIGPDGEDWDEVLLVQYPSLQAFLAMISMPEYQAMTVHRTAALQDARLTVDGPTRVGYSQPFGAFVCLEHTRQLARESGGFSKYLQNLASQRVFV